MADQGIFHESKPTFAGGELSPEMYARIDLAKYLTGLKTGRNVFVRPQGGVANRPGFRYVAKAKYSNKKCRLIPFDVSDTQSYMIEVGDLYMRFYKNGSQIQMVGATGWLTSTVYNPGAFVTQGGLQYYCLVAHTSGTFATDLAAGKWVRQDIYEIPASYAEADLPKIKYTQSANTLYLAHPTLPPYTLQRAADTSWNLAGFPFVRGPFMDQNVSSTTITIDDSGMLPVLTASAPIFDSNESSGLWRTDLIIPAQSWNATAPAAGGQTAIATSGKFNLTTSGTWTGTVVVEKSLDGITWTPISQQFVSAANANFNTNGDAAETCLIRINVLTGGGIAGLTISLSADSFVVKLIFQQITFTSSTQITAGKFLLSAAEGAPFVAAAKALGTTWGPTSTWFEGAWSYRRGWPSTVAFYQDRLGWASTTANPLGNWWSKTGNYVDYGTSDPLADDDAISVNFPTRKLNQCKHLLPMYIVVALTSSGEVSIGPGGAGSFSPTSIDLRPQSYHGAADATPVIVGNQAIFVQARSSQVRSLSYQYFTNIFTGEILNLMSTHLFDGYTLTDMTYAESPDSLVFAVRSDGVLLCFTYLPEQQVAGWTHWDTDGSFESCAVIPATTYDELWVVVNRSFGRTIERLAQRLPTADTKDQFHVDGGIDSSTTAVPTGVITIQAGVNDRVAIFRSLVNYAAIIPAGTYTATTLATAIAAAMNTADPGNSYTCVVVGGKLQIGPTISAQVFSNNTNSAAVTLGFLANTGYSLTATAPNIPVSPATYVISGLDYLEGKPVMVLGDGNVYGPFTVTGGQITLPSAITLAHVGLAYVCDVETLNIERAGQDGTSQDRRTRVTQVTMRFANSLGGYVGPSADKLHLIVPSPTLPAGATYLPLFTGDVPKISITPDWKSNGRIFFRQTAPLPFTLTAVFPATESGDI